MAVRTLKSDPGRAAYRFSSTLDGRSWTLRIHHNQREGKLYATITDDAGVRQRAGVKLVANFPLLRLWSDTENRPPGELFALDPTQGGDDPGLDTLGDGFFLVYIDEATLP